MQSTCILSHKFYRQMSHVHIDPTQSVLISTLFFKYSLSKITNTSDQFCIFYIFCEIFKFVEFKQKNRASNLDALLLTNQAD